jgi:hypothetical protein
MYGNRDYPSTYGFDLRNGSRRLNSEAVLREIKQCIVTFSLTAAPGPTDCAFQFKPIDGDLVIGAHGG